MKSPESKAVHDVAQDVRKILLAGKFEIGGDKVVWAGEVIRKLDMVIQYLDEGRFEVTDHAAVRPEDVQAPLLPAETHGDMA